MRRLLCVVFVLLALALVGRIAAQGTYSTKYDNINLQQILSNDRLVDSHIRCMLNNGDEGCAPEAKFLKSIIPDALRTNCSKCSDKQRRGIELVLKHLTTKKRDSWKKLIAKFDPNGEFRKKYESQWRSRGINL